MKISHLDRHFGLETCRSRHPADTKAGACLYLSTQNFISGPKEAVRGSRAAAAAAALSPRKYTGDLRLHRCTAVPQAIPLAEGNGDAKK